MIKIAVFSIILAASSVAGAKNTPAETTTLTCPDVVIPEFCSDPACTCGIGTYAECDISGCVICEKVYGFCIDESPIRDKVSFTLYKETVNDKRPVCAITSEDPES